MAKQISVRSGDAMKIARNERPRWPKTCCHRHVIIDQKNPFRYLSALSKNVSLRPALRFATIVLLGSTLLVVPLRGATIETRASLTQPLRTLPQVRFSNGTFYGTVFGGFNGDLDHGSVYQLGPTGSLTTLYQFQALTPDEANPTVLIGAADGNLYGATAPRAVGDLNGMIFKLTPAGTFTPLFRFVDGKGTHAISLIQGADGNFYGTAAGDSSGGFFNHLAAMHNAGIFFQLTPAGTFTVLYSFTGGADGSLPNSLVQGKDGNFYGSTLYGPETPPNVFNGYGTVFKFTPAGALTTLYSFTGAGDGGNPGKVVQGSDNNFYGVASFPTIGTVFKITPAGQRSTLFSLQGANGTDSSRLTLSTDGDVYGTTPDAGIPKAGSIFRINPAGQVTTYIFDGEGTGGHPSQLFEGEEHNLYGATGTGGGSNQGTIFRLNMAPPRNLLNISTRAQVLTADKVLIAGFIITGSDPKKVIIRGIGPSLAGVGTALQDPILELHQGSATLAISDDWKEHQADVEATTIPPTNDLESAIVATLAPGAYTAILSGKNSGTGVGVVEVYDLAQAANSKLANISTRGLVDTGENVMIAGLIVDAGGGGGGNARVILRALGPSLSASGIQGALPDPELELHDASGTTIASNDNWKIRPDGSSQQGEVEATSIPPTDSLESALVQTLPPGSYTAIVRGANDSTGVATVEIYNLQ
jgi:uncharacterized repeat protein (TIGR03803 family)